MSEFDSDDDIEPTDFRHDFNHVYLVDEDVLFEIMSDTDHSRAWVERIPVMYCENNDRIYNVIFQDESVQRIRITPNKWHDEIQIFPIVQNLLLQKRYKQ